MPKPLTVWITKNCGKFLEMEIPDHLTYLWRNLCADQEATVSTGHGTTDWFQIRKGIYQYIYIVTLLINLYAKYIMRNDGLKKHKLESRLLGEISITSDTQMTCSGGWGLILRVWVPAHSPNSGEAAPEARPGFDPWVGRIPWRREQLPTPVFWPGEFHGLYSPSGPKELDMTEVT